MHGSDESLREQKLTNVVISLTTIPPRFSHLGKCLKSLLDQTAKISAINLYIPETYKRFNFDMNNLPKLPKGVNLRLVKKDIGPATKILPAVNEYRGSDTVIISCDDDRVYDCNWAQLLINAANLRPDHAICTRGFMVSNGDQLNDGWTSNRNPKFKEFKKVSYHRWRRAISFGMWKRFGLEIEGYADILEGYGGFIVKPEFFDDAANNIPDILWTVDDVWLSGCLERRGVPIWRIKETVASNSTFKRGAASPDALNDLVYKGHGRDSANQLCIDYFRDTYGIWGG
jgi:hypothetical protein